MFSKLGRSRFFSATSTVALVLYGFFVAQFIVVFCAQVLAEVGVLSQGLVDSAAVQLFAVFCAYALALGIIVGLYAAIRNSSRGIAALLALDFKPNLLLPLYILLGYGAYFLLTFIFGVIAQVVIPGFNIEQKQEVGFEQLSSLAEYMMAFCALVILAPIVEEIIFRGFMYSRLRSVCSFVVTSLVVSATFGLVHMQWNVAIDVFALSLVLCALREYTRSIWAGVGVHMLKNAIAFVVLFLVK